MTIESDHPYRLVHEELAWDAYLPGYSWQGRSKPLYGCGSDTEAAKQASEFWKGVDPSKFRNPKLVKIELRPVRWSP
jgi:hypothetical protein